MRMYSFPAALIQNNNRIRLSQADARDAMVPLRNPNRPIKKTTNANMKAGRQPAVAPNVMRGESKT